MLDSDTFSGPKINIFEVKLLLGHFENVCNMCTLQKNPKDWGYITVIESSD